MAAPASSVAKRCLINTCNERHDISEHRCDCGMFGHSQEHHNNPEMIAALWSTNTPVAQEQYIALMKSMPDMFGSTTCRIAWCTRPNEHITAGHYCDVCRSYGHGHRSHSAVADGLPEIKSADSIPFIHKISRGDFMPGESCSYPGCKYLHTHKSSYHLCSVCDKYGGNKECNNCRVIAPCRYCASAANAGHLPSCQSWHDLGLWEREPINPAEEGIALPAQPAMHNHDDEHKVPDNIIHYHHGDHNIDILLANMRSEFIPNQNMQGFRDALNNIDPFVNGYEAADFDEPFLRYRFQNLLPVQGAVEPAARASNTYRIKCPQCRVINTVDITKDYIAGLSGTVPEDCVPVGENSKNVCFCTESWADVVMPTCRHLGCCKKCIPKMQQEPVADNHGEEFD